MELERDFRNAVVELAELCHWTVHFNDDSRRSHGRGWPDLVLARDGVVLFRECKRDGKYLSPEQDDWRVLLELAGLDYGVWRPSDWDEIERVLA